MLKKVWPVAAHQLCLFHETRHVTKSVMEAIQDLRTSLPSPPPAERHSKSGPVVNHPPSDDPNNQAVQRWNQRRKERQDGIKQVHHLLEQGLSQRAIARQTGLNRRTIAKWLQKQIPTAYHGNQSEGVNQPDQKTVELTDTQKTSKTAEPPDPWIDWDEVRRVREALQEYRSLFVKHLKHLSREENEHIFDLVNSPIGTKLQTLYSFMKDWYAFWKNQDNRRLPASEAKALYLTWQACETYHHVKPLQRVLSRITLRPSGLKR
jgi:transposase